MAARAGARPAAEPVVRPPTPVLPSAPSRWSRGEASAARARGQPRRGRRATPTSSCSATSRPSSPRSPPRSSTPGRASRSSARRRSSAVREAYPGSAGRPVDPEHCRSRSAAAWSALDRRGAGRARARPIALRARSAPSVAARRRRLIDAAMAVMSLRAGVRGARGRGPGRRGRAPRRSRPPVARELAAGAWPAPPRCSPPATTTPSPCAARSPRRAGRPAGAWPRSSAAACGRRSRTPSQAAIGGEARYSCSPTPATRSPTTSARSSTSTLILIFAYIVANLLFSLRRARAVLAAARTRSSASCATCASRTCGSSAASSR